MTEALEPGLRTRGYVFNTLLQDKAIGDRLREYPSWISSRNLSNEASDESVQALVEAVQGRYELARRWYRVKARLLGVEQARRLRPDGERRRRRRRDRLGARAARSSATPSPRSRASAAEVADRFFDERWVDVPPREGKRGGAFSAPTVPAVHPYVMLNYTGRRRDVLTLAHELGHGIHQTSPASRAPSIRTPR